MKTSPSRHRSADRLPMRDHWNGDSNNKTMVMVGRRSNVLGWSASGTPKQALVASRLCDYLAASTFRPDDLAMPGNDALRLTDEVFLNFDYHRRGPCQGHYQILVNRKDKA
jgi:hypothetical protein